MPLLSSLSASYQNSHRQFHHHDGFYNILLFILILGCHLTKTITTTHPNSLGVFMVRSPESIIAPQGDEVLFECQLNLVPERLEWRFRPVKCKSNSKDYIYLNKNSTFNISNEDGTSKLRMYVNSDTLGEYQCVAWFGASALASIPARLTLATIRLDESDDGSDSNDLNHRGNRPTEQTLRWRVSPKNNVLIKCGNVISNPPPVWSFYKDGLPISQPDIGLPSGALVLHSVTSKNAGTYYCTAINAITGTEIKMPRKVQLTVEHTQRSPPYFLIQPPNKFSARPGQNIVLECPGVGNPPPKAVWSSPDFNISNNRISQLDYGLQIVDINPQDHGTYVCRLDNGIAPVLVQTIRLEVLEQPVILKGPQTTLTNESDSLELDCIANGSPTPEIYWMINGADTRWDPQIKQDGNKLIIKSVEKKHAGIVQCFAKNEVGEANESNLLQVNPKQIPGEIGMQPLGSFPTKSTYDHPGKQNKGRKKHKIPNMVPPSRPNVTRLSDDSVMIRWYVPKNEGLSIQFFKVQYRMLGNPAKKISRENWQTTNDDIPYGKRDKNNEGVKNFTSSVRGLKPDRYYRFRIIAVYSNNDNKEGNSSGKFLLQRASQLGPLKSHIPPPILTKIEGVSETAITLHWIFPTNESNPVDGFYAHYRPASTAGDYLKATVDGADARQFKIDMLEPDTAYEFKLQSFTSSTASDFSSILTGKTLKPVTPPPSVTPSVIPASESSQDSNSMLPVIAGAAVGGILLIVVPIVLCLCLKKRKKTQRDDDNKEHIQADATHFVPSPVMSSQHHKSVHRMNGVMPRMNITANPLAQEGDKNRNVMELRFMPTTGGSNHHANQQQNQQEQQQQQQIPMAPPTSVQQQQLQQQQQQQPLTSVTGIPLHHPHHHLHQQHQKPYHHQHQQMLTVTPLALAAASSSSPSPTMCNKHYPQPQQQQQQLPPLQNNNHHNNSTLQQQHHMNHFQAPLTPFLEQHRRTLERSTRNLHYPPPLSVQSHHHHSGTTLDAADGIVAIRTPSLRRTRRTSGSANNGGCGSGGSISTTGSNIGASGIVSANSVNIVPSSPRIQRSPMPTRAAVTAAAIKRNRLGSHTENMSSGSLNSIEV